MSIFRIGDYTGKKSTSSKKDNSATKGHYSKQKGIRANTPWKSDKTKWIFHCPRMCQQRPNGTLGKKTYDGKECNSCGFKK